MAETTLNTALEVQKWESDFFSEYVRDTEFAPFSGTSKSSVIVLKEDLLVGSGKYINIPMISKLSNDAILGSAYLKGSEEELNQHNHQIQIIKRRQGVLISDADMKTTIVDLLDAGREELMVWAMDDKRQRIVDALSSVSGIAYATATAAQRNTWAVNNSDRVLYGQLTGNYSGVHATDLAKIDTADDKMDADIIRLARRIARTSDPLIRPFRLQSGGRQEMYVVFMGSRAFRDLSADAAVQTAQREVFPRNPEGNPIFNGNSTIMFAGCLIVEVPSIGVLTGVGDSSSDVEPFYLCGAGALAHAMGRRLRHVKDTDDYGDKMGIGVELIDGIEKLIFNDKDNGVLTGFVSASGDA